MTSQYPPDVPADEGELEHCSEPGCEATVKNHYWGRVKADLWFFQKNGDAWCPDHHPEWVAAWRARKKAREEQ